MVSPHKRRRTTSGKPSADVPSSSSSSPPPPPVWSWKLPVELMREIAARSDATTFVRLAAACKLLHREILTLDFLSRVCTAPPGLVPARLHSYLNKTFCLAQDHHHRRPVVERRRRRQRNVGFVSRSSCWSWGALCTRRQDDEADVQDEHWRRALKTLYINSQICV